jgi:hypothetical protein
MATVRFADILTLVVDGLAVANLSDKLTPH